MGVVDAMIEGASIASKMLGEIEQENPVVSVLVSFTPVQAGSPGVPVTRNA